MSDADRNNSTVQLSNDPEIEAGFEVFDPKVLIKIANQRMPFGKYVGLRLIDLPERYVVWFHNQGFPKGELGELLALLYEIKLNGLEGLLAPLRGPECPVHN